MLETLTPLRALERKRPLRLAKEAVSSGCGAVMNFLADSACCWAATSRWAVESLRAVVAMRGKAERSRGCFDYRDDEAFLKRT